MLLNSQEPLNNWKVSKIISTNKNNGTCHMPQALGTGTGTGTLAQAQAQAQAQQDTDTGTGTTRQTQTQTRAQAQSWVQQDTDTDTDTGTGMGTGTARHKHGHGHGHGHSRIQTHKQYAKVVLAFSRDKIYTCCSLTVPFKKGTSLGPNVQEVLT